MTRQLATLVGAGIPLVESIGALVEQVEKEELKRVLTAVREKLNEGTSFAKALEPHPTHLPAALREHGRGRRGVGHARAGARAARRLHGVAGAASRQGRRRRSPTRSSMVIIGIVLISVLMVAVVPKVTAIFESMDRRCPGTRSCSSPSSNFAAELLVAHRHRWSSARHLVVPPLEEDARRAG